MSAPKETGMMRFTPLTFSPPRIFENERGYRASKDGAIKREIDSPFARSAKNVSVSSLKPLAPRSQTSMQAPQTMHLSKLICMTERPPDIFDTLAPGELQIRTHLLQAIHLSLV